MKHLRYYVIRTSYEAQQAFHLGRYLARVYGEWILQQWEVDYKVKDLSDFAEFIEIDVVDLKRIMERQMRPGPEMVKRLVRRLGPDILKILNLTDYDA